MRLSIFSLPASLSILALAYAPDLRAQSLIRDIRQPNSTVRHSDPEQIVFINGDAIFVAEDEYGTELWISDGTVNGTRPLKDVNPGAASATPDDLIVVGNRVYFTANVAGIGRELWATDGTSAGTELLRDINPGPSSGFASVRYLVEYSGKLFFGANDGSNGTELWCSDGTTAGTQIAADRPGAAGLDPKYLTVSNGTLFFRGSGSSGTRLWKTLGAAATTQEVGSVPFPHNLHDFNDVLLFAGGNLTSTDYELFRSDGTAGGTLLVAEIRPGNSGSNIDRYTNLGGVCLFTATDGSNGDELWVTDGTAGGTSLVLDLQPGAGSSSVTEIVSAGGKVYLNPLSGAYRELWCTDGTALGTQLVADPSGPTSSSNPVELTEHGGMLYFAATGSGQGRELWKTDGSVGGTQLVRDIYPGTPGSSPAWLASDGTHVWFQANDGVYGTELWRSDGSPFGTLLIRDLAPTAGDSSPTTFVDFNGSLVFVPDDGTTTEPWISDGSPLGTVPLGIGHQNINIVEAAVWNGTLWLNATSAGAGYELWSSDGTPGGTSMAFEFAPGGGGLRPAKMLPMASGILCAGTGPNGIEPYFTDGTLAGTFELADIRPNSSQPSIQSDEFVLAGGEAFFAAYDGTTSGTELWKTDATIAGTVRVADIRPGSASSNPSQITALGASVVFVANDGLSGSELWISDGTLGGTQLLADIRPGASSSTPDWLVGNGSQVFFTAYEPAHGEELYVTDGVTTTRFSDVAIDGPGGDIEDVVIAGGLVFFTADDDVHGDELWVSDGTPIGTQMVMNIGPGARDGVLRGTLAPIGTGALVGFAASDGVDGLQFWISDGTVGGTLQQGSIGTLPGVGAAMLGAPFTAGTTIYFTADDGVLGRELWGVSLSGTGGAYAFPFGQGCYGTGGAIPALSAVGAPSLGNASFALQISNSLPGAPATTLLAFAPTSITLSGCHWYLAAPVLDLGSSITDGSGVMTTNLPMPTDPFWLGQQVFFQSAVVDPGGQFFGDVALTQGLQISIGN